MTDDAESETSIDTLAELHALLDAREGGLAGVLRKAGLPIGEGLAGRLALVDGEGEGEAEGGAAPNGAEEACRLAELAMSDAPGQALDQSDTPDTMLSLLTALKATQGDGPSGLSVW